MSWINQLVRKRKFKLVLLVLAIITGVSHLFSQFIYFLVLNQEGLSNLVSPSSSGHSRPNVAINKIISKWNDSQHSKFIRDKDGHSISLRGTRSRDIAKYLPNTRGKFVCIASRLEIDFLKVNDDYCDCPMDGSDEPGTNACNNGIFYCEMPSKIFPGIFIWYSQLSIL